MEKDFDYSNVPHNFIHCINAHCNRSGECLRRRAMLHIDAGRPLLQIVNPVGIPENGEDCIYFLPGRKTKLALGITHLLDSIPHTKALKIKRELSGYFSKGTYYRISTKERPVTPAEQEYIRQLFITHNIDAEPVFDEYVEEYQWFSTDPETSL